MSDYGEKYETARDRVLNALQGGEWVSWKVLDRVGGNRYSARVLELKRLGYMIESRPDPSGDGQQYRLVSPYPGPPQTKRVKVFLDEADAEELLTGHLTPAAGNAVLTALESFRINRSKL